jgi:hypothetical protein
MFVCHHCDVKRCVNPVHMFLGYGRDNAIDMFSKNLGPIGENSPRAKMTIARAEEIRSIYSGGGHSERSLAAQYGVCHQTIGAIIRRERWIPGRGEKRV